MVVRCLLISRTLKDSLAHQRPVYLHSICHELTCSSDLSISEKRVVRRLLSRCLHSLEIDLNRSKLTRNYPTRIFRKQAGWPCPRPNLVSCLYLSFVLSALSFNRKTDVSTPACGSNSTRSVGMWVRYNFLGTYVR